MPPDMAPDVAVEARTPAVEAEAKGRRPVPFRGGTFRPRAIPFAAPLVFLVLIGLCELGSRSGLISPIALPAPSEAIAAMGD